MSIMKRGPIYYVRFRPFGDLINIRTSASSKTEARQIEVSVLTACRAGDYQRLDAKSREACLRMFRNRQWSIPERLSAVKTIQKELTLWDAVELFLKYPTVKDSKAKERYIYCCSRLVEHFGKEGPLKSMRVPEIREYQAIRLSKGAAPGTINREVSALSRLFGVMMELQHVETNPAREVERLSEKSGERQVYLSFQDVELIASKCPSWIRPLVWTAYYTGMRRGEILGLTRKRLNLSKRMIYLGPDDTKEGHWKRVPIHQELVPILAEVLQGPVLISGKVFPLSDGGGIRELELETFKNPWERACKALQKEEQEKGVKEPKWEKPWPRFNDLRHTWRTNARRSGVDPQIAESIMGHWFKGKSVNDRYGRISDKELLDAIDQITFDHGETEIWTARQKNVIKV